MVSRAKDQLEDAEDFLGAAIDLYKTGRWAKVCFNAQQAAELAFKSILSFHGVERRGQSLLDLLEELSAIDRRFQVFEEAAKILDQYYIPTRYANAFPSGSARRHFTEAQAKQALDYAKTIIEEAKRIVLQGPA